MIKLLNILEIKSVSGGKLLLMRQLKKTHYYSVYEVVEDPSFKISVNDDADLLVWYFLFNQNEADKEKRFIKILDKKNIKYNLEHYQGDDYIGISKEYIKIL